MKTAKIIAKVILTVVVAMDQMLLLLSVFQLEWQGFFFLFLPSGGSGIGTARRRAIPRVALQLRRAQPSLQQECK